MERPHSKWLRSKNGLVAGVCAGLSETLGIDLVLMRIIWVVATFFSFGTSLVIYMALAICLPREDRLNYSWQPMLLGVSKKIAYKTGIEIGIVRLVFFLFTLFSLGLASLFYLVLYFVMPDPHDLKNVN
jgi:phage shock protein PspC (stress-responsive transcriptional regulator)